MDKRRKTSEQLGVIPSNNLITSNSYSWAFKIDLIHDYAYVDNFLSKKECEYIVAIGKSKELLKATVVGDGVYPSLPNEKISKVRQANVSWLAPTTDNLHWLYRRLTDSITILNKKYFNFDVSGIQEGLQFTHYKAPKDKFDFHMDRSYNFQIRKLSITIQLSNPVDYKGGELELFTGTKPTLMKKNQGRLIMFPSFVLHRVKPITKGERNALVVWITGSQFK